MIISIDSSPFDEIAQMNRMIICSWWELQYPERILHRYYNGERTDDDKAELKVLQRKIQNEKEEWQEAKLKEKKRKKEREAKQKEYLFAGTVNFEQFALIDDGHENSISVTGVDELKEVVIAISRTKFRLLFDGILKNQQERKKASGYKIRVVDISQKPKNLTTAENATAYLLNCNPILPEDEKEDS